MFYSFIWTNPLSLLLYPHSITTTVLFKVCWKMKYYEYIFFNVFILLNTFIKYILKYKHSFFIHSKHESYFCSENNPNSNCFWSFVILRAITFNSEEYMKQQLLGQLTNKCGHQVCSILNICVKWLQTWQITLLQY